MASPDSKADKQMAQSSCPRSLLFLSSSEKGLGGCEEVFCAAAAMVQRQALVS